MADPASPLVGHAPRSTSRGLPALRGPMRHGRDHVAPHGRPAPGDAEAEEARQVRDASTSPGGTRAPRPRLPAASEPTGVRRRGARGPGHGGAPGVRPAGRRGMMARQME